MSPVSRGRRGRRAKRSKANASAGAGAGRPRAGGSPAGGGNRSAWTVTESLVSPRAEPEWFEPSITSVLDRAGVVLETGSPRELEEATATLLGVELHRIIRQEDRGLWFDWWFEQLIEAAVARIRVEGPRNGAWQAPWWLLHGLASIGPPTLSAAARTALGRAKKELRKDAYQSQPEWLRLLPRISATGEVWQLHDVYGARFAVIAGFSYPSGLDRSVFLFDVDACGLVRLAHAGVFDAVDEAAAAWRSVVGDAADRSSPAPIETAEQLACLVYCESGEDLVEGTEPRAVTDNWFRAPRRIHDLAHALRKRGMTLPPVRSLFHDIDTEPMVEAFVEWHRTTQGTEPDPEAVDAVAAEWLEGALPGTHHAASPHRAQYQLTLINDWKHEHPVTVAAKTLLPAWVRWNGEQAGLPAHFLDRAVAAAAGHQVSDWCSLDRE